MDVVLRDATARTLNARVEIDARGLVVHSRSGKVRNRDYRHAMELVLARLDAASVPFDVYLDSGPVQDMPLEQRRLVAVPTDNVADRFNALVRAMNKGSSSNGALRRVLIAAPGHTGLMLASIVTEGGRRNSSDARLQVAQLRLVTHEHIDRAVAQLLAGGDAFSFAASRDFDVLAPDGTRLAPKKVYGLAVAAALGIDARPEHFSAGLGTPCFRALEAAGYAVVRKGEVVPGDGAQPVDADLAAAEGNRKIVTHLRRERRPALAAAKKRAMVEKLGYLQCERCHVVPSQTLGPHGDAVIEVHHAGTQVADMSDGHVTRLADLVCLCANCHRITHREAMHGAGALGTR